MVIRTSSRGVRLPERSNIILHLNVLLLRFSNPGNFLQPGVIETVVSSIKKNEKSLTLLLREDQTLCKILPKTRHISQFIFGQSVLENLTWIVQKTAGHIVRKALYGHCCPKKLDKFGRECFDHHRGLKCCQLPQTSLPSPGLSILQEVIRLCKFSLFILLKSKLI